LSWARPWLDRAYGIAFRLAAGRADLYHEPNHIPVRCGRPTVTTVHDLSVLLHPEWHPPDRARWYERAFAAGVRQTVRFIAASEFTKQEMVRHLGLSPDRIDVTYQAPRPAFQPPTDDAVRATLAAYDLSPRFFLFVGTLEPRKNVAGLLESYAALPAAVRAAHPLVLAGGWGWRTDALAAQLDASPCRGEVRLIGYADDASLAALYAACTALVWPTWYEGFGLPPLEALACGAPVVVSNVASLPEVVGDAGVLLDPQDTAGWTTAMRRLAEDDAWRQMWRHRGPARAAEFSWRRCATQTLACYEAALAAAGGQVS
jgi:alpha-1,3-rhamnosyl/mannosyltransferase